MGKTADELWMATSDESRESVTSHPGDLVLSVSQVPVSLPQRTTSGGGRIRQGPRQPMAPTGRVCAHGEDHQRCTTILSVYNPADRCSLHNGFKSRDQAPSVKS